MKAGFSASCSPLALEHHELEPTDAVRNAECRHTVDGDLHSRRHPAGPSDHCECRSRANSRRRRAGERKTEAFAHAAAAAVSADDILRANGLRAARTFHDEFHEVIRGLSHLGGSRCPIDRDTREARQPVQEHAVRERLHEAVAPRPPELLGRRSEFGERLPVSVDETRASGSGWWCWMTCALSPTVWKVRSASSSIPTPRGKSMSSAPSSMMRTEIP